MRWIIFTVLAVSITIGFRSAPAAAQTQNSANQQDQPITGQQIDDETRQLIRDLNDPNYDYSKIPQQMRQIFQDVRTFTIGMDQDRARAYRRQIFLRIMPTIRANQQKIQQAMQVEFVNNLQAPLGCSDDEFAALRPFLVNVVLAMTEAHSGDNFARTIGNQQQQQQRRGWMQNQQPTLIQQSQQDLENVLEDPGSTSFAVDSGVSALRAAREKAQADLKIAQDQLRAYLTVRQEAVLVSYGLLS
ncbi:MAG TPA: hypothetical protein VL992_10540 [Tepidisphaeraceae bacterium]|nr:hypothetical protein [Tepidisphaeraceae bacterium]